MVDENRGLRRKRYRLRKEKNERGKKIGDWKKMVEVSLKER